MEIRKGLFAAKEKQNEAEVLCSGEKSGVICFEDCFCEWLSYWGPVSLTAILDIVPLSKEILDRCFLVT